MYWEIAVCIFKTDTSQFYKWMEDTLFSLKYIGTSQTYAFKTCFTI